MKTRDKIKEACLDLFIKHGLEGTSTKMILEYSGVSNGSLFNHFPNKDEILKEIFIDITTEKEKKFQEVLDINKPTRPFLYDLWKVYIGWHLANKQKSEFIEMYANSATIKNCYENSTNQTYNFIVNRIETALNNEEIISHSTVYFFLHFMNVSKAVTLYIHTEPEIDTDDFIKKEFNQYWRSVAKF